MFRKKKKKQKDYIENRQIRIFISSTFKDMQKEREYLVAKVFPGLRKYCEEREVSLFEVDLRWGITQKESENQKALKICLDEVKKTKPFFIGLLGERYGWIPEKDKIKKMKKSGVFKEYKWLQNEVKREISITEAEIIAGVLNLKEKVNAYFYFRSPKMTIPDTEEYRDKKESDIEKMRLLKNKIENKKIYPIKYYNNDKDDEHLGKLVESDFKTLIDNEFPTPSEDEEEQWNLENERRKQRILLKIKTRVYAEDKKIYAELNNFTKGKEKVKIITGKNGIGKSAFLANWIINRQNKKIKNERIIYHFSSNNENYFIKSRFISRLIDEVIDIYDLPEKIDREVVSFWNNNFTEINPLYKSEEEELHDLLEAIPENEKLIIILDGNIDLCEIDIKKMIEWMPEKGNNIKIILTALLNDKTIDILNKNNYKYINLSTLSLKQRKVLIKKYYKSYKKKLISKQVNKIAEAKLSEEPFSLLSIINNLRIFGNHELLNKQIDEIIVLGSHEEVFNSFFENINKSFLGTKAPENILKDVLSLIMVSKNGLSESVIKDVIEIPPLYWSQLYNILSEYLSIIDGKVVISNKITKDTINKIYFNKKNTEHSYRIKLKDDYMKSNEKLKFSEKYNEILYQLFKLEDWENLYNILLDHKVILGLYEYNSLDDNFDELIKYWKTLIKIDANKYDIRKYNEIGNNLIEFDIIRFYKNIFHLIINVFEDYSLGLEFALKYKFYYEIYNEKLAEKYHNFNEFYEEINNENKIDIMHIIGSCFIGLQKYEKAIDYFDQIIVFCKLLQEEDPEFCNCYESEYYAYNKLGKCYSSLKKYKEAIENYEKALKFHVGLYGEEVYDVNEIQERIDLYKNFSFCYYKLENYQKALECDHESHMLQVELLGKDDPETIETISDIGLEYHEIRNYQKALEYHHEALNLRLKIYNEIHEDVAFSYHKAGMAYEALGETDKANECFNKEKEINEQLTENEEIKQADETNIESNENHINNEEDVIQNEKDLNKYKNIKSKKDAIELFKKDFSSILSIPEKFLIEEFYLEAVKYYSYIFKKIPEKSLTERIILAAVKQDAELFDFIPDNHKTKENYFTAVVNYKHVESCSSATDIRVIEPEELKTKDSCEIEVIEYKECLKDIPEKFKTFELCLTAVKHHGLAIKYVPENIISNEILIEAVRQDGKAIKFIPENLLNNKILEEAIKQNGKAIELIPENLLTYELCLIAVEQKGVAIKFVPEKYKTKELCLESVNYNYNLLEFVPENILNDEILLEAIRQNGEAIKLIPVNILTYELCLMAVKQNGVAIIYVPDKYKSEELCLISVSRNKNMLKFVPEEFKIQVEKSIKGITDPTIENNSSDDIIKHIIYCYDRHNDWTYDYHPSTKEICNEIFKYRKEIFNFMPDEFKTKEMCLIMVKQNILMLYYVPKELLDYEVYMEAVKNDGATLAIVPDELITKEMCLIAVKSRGFVLFAVPKELKTKEICIEAVKQNNAAMEYVPEEWVLAVKEAVKI